MRGEQGEGSGEGDKAAKREGAGPASQSQRGRENIPVAGTNRSRGGRRFLSDDDGGDAKDREGGGGTEGSGVKDRGGDAAGAADREAPLDPTVRAPPRTIAIVRDPKARLASAWKDKVGRVLGLFI